MINVSLFHFLRPWALFAFLPFLVFIFYLVKHKHYDQAKWQSLCDAHLMPYILQKSKVTGRKKQLIPILLSGAFFSLSLAGPTWDKIEVPIYEPIHPKVILLNLSPAMMLNDITPDRLTRAKFKLHDLFLDPNIGQVGLIVYSSEPFVVSPITRDAKTIHAMLDELSYDILPVGGNNLESALFEGAKLIHQSGYKEGKLLVLTANIPSEADIQAAATLASQGIKSSILPVIGQATFVNQSYEAFAKAGKGKIINLLDQKSLTTWAQAKTSQNAILKANDEVIVWKDQGRWFLLPGLVFLLPLFRRGFREGIFS